MHVRHEEYYKSLLFKSNVPSNIAKNFLVRNIKKKKIIILWTMSTKNFVARIITIFYSWTRKNVFHLIKYFSERTYKKNRIIL